MDEKKDLERVLESVDSEYFEIVSSILYHEEFLKRKEYHHHENRSVYVHCVMVSTKAYQIAKKLHLDYKKAAIGGLLHDFYYEDWQKNIDKKTKMFQQHGFVHAKEAVDNSKKYFPELIDKKTENIIRRHMFPLNIVPPRYMESWIITIVDKYVSCEIFKTPKQLYKYVGLSFLKKKK